MSIYIGFTDLNPIEFLWKKIKSLVYDGPQFEKKSDLWLKILNVVKILKNDKNNFVTSLYEGIDRHYMDVIKKNGDN